MTERNKVSVVLVAGASSGLGRAVAERLTADGFRTYAGARSFAKGISAPAGCEPVDLNVLDDTSAQDAVSYIVEREGHIDALINCAAFLRFGSCEETSAGELEAVVQTNFLGMARMTRTVLPYMRAQHFGRIINFSSINGLLGIPFQSAYTASKHAIEGWSECLAQETRRFGVRVTLIEPGDCRNGSSKYRTSAAASRQESSPYAVWYKGAVEQITHDENNGMPPDRVASAVSAVLSSGSPPARRLVARIDQRFAVFLHKFIGGNFFYKIMESYYAPKNKEKEKP